MTLQTPPALSAADASPSLSAAVLSLPARPSDEALVRRSDEKAPRSMFRRALAALGEGLGVFGLVLAFPLAILAIGLPIVLLVRLAIWLLGLM